MTKLENQLEQARMLASRLERLSADSTWARRASGYRASLLKAIERLEAMPDQAEVEIELEHLEILLQRGHQILVMAAKDLIRNRMRGKV